MHRVLTDIILMRKKIQISTILRMFLRSIWRPSSRLVSRLTAEEKVVRLTEGIMGGDRACLSSAVTLVESKNASKKSMGQQILTNLLNDPRGDSDSAFRIGLSGPPGAGKVGSLEMRDNP